MSENKLACRHDERVASGALRTAASLEAGALARDQPDDRWVLEARGLHKSYGARQVVNGVSLRVAAGEGVALLGPNGSGKTTLLGLLAGVLRADGGSALACGVPVAKRRARCSLAFVPQHPAVYDELTAEENVLLFGRLHGMRGAPLRAAVHEALDAAELWPLRTQRASAYSGGMRRRLSLACALVHSPSLLLLDEPFEGVDEESRSHLLEVLASKQRGGVALVLSTHRLDEVSALCERFVLLREGRVIAERRIDQAGESHELTSAVGALRDDA